MSKPRLLDLFCGAGGAAMGYHMAGFDVTGIDIEPQPAYPFRFVRTDALSVSLTDFDAIHASPPCQDYSLAMRHLSAPTPRLIAPTHELLEASGLPWVIENVPGAPLPTQSTLDGRHGVELCGSMFGLRIRRHRLFECSFAIEAPSGCRHYRPAMNAQSQNGRNLIYNEFGRQDPDPLWNAAMGVGWMGRYEGREAIPPAMTHFIGLRLLREVLLPLSAAATGDNDKLP